MIELRGEATAATNSLRGVAPVFSPVFSSAPLSCDWIDRTGSPCPIYVCRDTAIQQQYDGITYAFRPKLRVQVVSASPRKQVHEVRTLHAMQQQLMHRIHVNDTPERN